MDGTDRPPAVAGHFYRADGEGLAKEVESCFLSARGPGHLPDPHRSSTRRIRAAIVPHAGLLYSGPIAALVYEAIAVERSPEVTVILGVDHHGTGREAALSDRRWAMPIGPIPVDHDLVRRMAHGPIGIDEEAHRLEHSIEVQLPFLDYVLPHPKIVPLLVPFRELEFLQEVARIVREAIQGRDVLLLASTDLSHYVPAPVAERLDRLAIQQILDRSPEGLYRTVREHDISMCGIAPTTTLLASILGEPLTARLLRWGHSGEAQPMREVVGYAGIVLETPEPF
jgi:AmmeMemoRadiSam system protein B